MRQARRALLTVRQVVKLARASERTVRADIAAGRLPVVRFPNGRVFVRGSAVIGYRHVGYEPGDLVSIREFCRRSGETERTVRRQLARSSSRLSAVKVSSHRLYIHRSVANEWFPRPADADAHRRFWGVIAFSHVRDVATLLSMTRHALKEGAADADMYRLFAERRAFLHVREVATLLGMTPRAVYHAIEKGALRAVEMGGGRVVRVSTWVALKYAGKI